MNVRPTKSRALLVILAALALAWPGCRVNSETPLSDPEKSAADEKLLGTWESAYYVLAGLDFVTIEKVSRPDYPRGVMKITISGKDSAGAPKAGGLMGICFTTTLKNKRFISVAVNENKEGAELPAWDKVRNEKGYLIYKYDVNDKGLTIYDFTGVNEAFSAGKLKGKPVGGLNYSSFYITDTRAKLAEFLLSEDASCLEFMKLKKKANVPEKKESDLDKKLSALEKELQDLETRKTALEKERQEIKKRRDELRQRQDDLKRQDRELKQRAAKIVEALEKMGLWQALPPVPPAKVEKR